jgi:hypothetical protein
MTFTAGIGEIRIALEGIFREFRGWNGLVGRGFLGKEQIV